MRRLIVARHGNTFRPDDIPVWVGARTDLPLVEKGVAQANALAEALKKNKVALAALIAGPLTRTRQTAEIVASALDISPAQISIEPRLTEIDYGRWEGETTDAIIAAGDEVDLHQWNKHSVFPNGAGWKPKESQIKADIETLLADTEDGTSLLITSNGILRFFAEAALNKAEIADRKVATGNLCLLQGSPSEGWRVSQWNQPPDRLDLSFKS